MVDGLMVFVVFALVIGLLVTLASHLGKRALRQIEQGRRRACRLCGYDLRASADRCPECGMLTTRQLPTGSIDVAALVAAWPPSPIAVRSPGPDESQQTLYRSADAAAVETMAAFLRAAGIAATARTRTAAADAVLLVCDADADRAEAALGRYVLPADGDAVRPNDSD